MNAAGVSGNRRALRSGQRTIGQLFGRLARSAETVFWIAFIFAASNGLSRIPVAEKAVWLVADLFAVLCIMLEPRRYLAAITANAILLVCAGLAILSALWSHEPSLSLYHGVQLLLTTLVGVVILGRMSITEFMRLMFYALGIGLCLSLMFVVALPSEAVSPAGEWRGLYTHKNTLGSLSVIMIFTSLALGWNHYRRALTGAGAVLALGLVIMSRSGTSIMMLASLVPIAFVFLRPRSRASELVLIGALGCLIISVVCLALTTEETALTSKLFTLLGKDETLSGRTILWQFGWEMYMDYPILGVGYKAYWDSYATSSAYLKFFLGQDVWFFHNNFLEVAVSLGSVGLAVFVIGLIIVASRSYRLATTWSPKGAWCFLMFSVLLMLCFLENPLFVNHNVRHVILVVLCGAAVAVQEANSELKAGRVRGSALVPGGLRTTSAVDA